MKRNLLYLAGFLLAAATVFSGCNDDDPSYHDLVPNTQEIGRASCRERVFATV